METLSTSLQPFFEWLLRSTFQAGIVVCLILLIQAALRNRLTARWHYALWLILVVRMVLPWAPQSRFSIFNLAMWQGKPNVPGHTLSKPDAESPEVVRESSATQRTTAGQEQSIKEDGTDVAAGSDVSSKPLAAGPELTSSTEGQNSSLTAPTRISRESVVLATEPALWLSGVLPLLWLAGALLLGGYIIICNLRLWRAASIECPSTDKEILELLEECRSEIGLRTIVALIPSEKVNTPILLGFVRPRLLVPGNIAKQLTREELRYVFLHELAHVKRHDIALGWLTALLQVLHWFNPLVWLAFHRMRSNRELACDALVLSRTRGEGTQDYGLAIVSLLEHFSAPQPLPGLAGILESKSQLKRRIAMITEFDNKSYRWSPLAAILLLMLTCVVLLDAPRTKASATATTMQEPTLRRIEVVKHGTRSAHSSPSPDGKYIASMTEKGPDLVVKELATGKTWNLTKDGGATGMAIMPSISPDNTKVAYYWYSFETRRWEARVVRFDGSNDRLLLPAEKIPGWLYIDTWSPDGRFLFGRHARLDKDDSARLVKISVDDDSMQYIEVVDANDLSKIDISSDGRFLAYHRKDKTTSKSDIFVFDLEQNRESVLVRDPADDKLMGWTPDGQHIFFTRDRMGTRDGWLLAVQQGKPKGLPRMIKPGMGDVVPIRLTCDGSLYYAAQYETWNVYTVELDVELCKALSELKAVGGDVGEGGWPDWSHDGRYLAYCSQPGPGRPQVIHIRSLTTGEERELKPDLPHFECLRWHPDSRHLLAPYLKSPGLSSVSQIDIRTGECTELATAPVTRGERIRQAELSADGKTLAYRIRDGSYSNRLIVKNMETGREKELLRLEPLSGTTSSSGNSWTLLPDGKQVALSIPDDASFGPRQLKTVSVETGETKTIVPYRVGWVTWANNGRDLLFVRQRKELWCVAAKGSEPQKVWECEQIIHDPRMHPDGKQLAFVIGKEVSEMWVMENFLPEED